MPRRSSEALAVQVARVPNQRPQPPREFGKEEAQEWNQIVGSMPVDWFTMEMWPLLSALCTDIVILRRTSESLRKMRPEDKQFAALSKIQMQYTDLIARISTKLRLTPQSRFNQHSAKRATKDAIVARQRKMPWGDDAGAAEAAE